MKDLVKSTLQKTGLFPFVRTVYRRIDHSIQKQSRREVDFYSELLRPNGLCFDVGANLGQRSEVFLKLGNRSVIVEPNPNCRDNLNFPFRQTPRLTLS